MTETREQETRRATGLIPCGHCGVPLFEDEIRFLWSDVDWLEHGDHYASVRDEDFRAYVYVAKQLTA